MRIRLTPDNLAPFAVMLVGVRTGDIQQNLVASAMGLPR